MKQIIRSVLISCGLLLIAQTQAQTKVKLDHHTFGAIEARHIGPATMSGRIAALDAVQEDPRIIYVGAAAGGVWKSTNGGVQFKPVFDKHNQCIGALTIDQNHPDTIWVGTGEPWTRNSVSVGDGIYVSYDGGENWKHKGLKNTERIAKIIIHPKDSSIIYVAALGHLWNANEERGLFKSTDGGETWNKILYVDENTGCSDIALDYDNPDIMYAGMWDFRRKPYTFRSGGPGSALYRSEDGGETWEKVENGIPEGTLGRIALTVSPISNRVYALIESEKSAMYRSDDKGKTWEETNNTSDAVKERPFYFQLIYADPVDTNTVWKPGFRLLKSEDGGEKFTNPSVFGGAYHVDLHAFWISKKDKNFMYLGTDGGVYVSNDRGNTWRMIRNLPVSTFYHVSVDNEDPYNVYGGLQDNGSWMGPSQASSGISNCDWKNLGGGDGFYVYRDKLKPHLYYAQSQGGNVSRLNINTNERKSIKPFKDNNSEELRFNWNTPVYFSKDGKRMYMGAQYLYRSENNGDSWERISNDLTTDDTEKQKQLESGGLTIDNSTAENHCTIYAISESPLDKNIIWAGTDDGNIQVTSNGGKSWENVTSTLEGLPSNSWCSSIHASSFNKMVAFATFDGHRHGDMKPYVYMTRDLGKTWSALANDNITSYCHYIIQDPVAENLLFLGTEMGLFVSINGGEIWSQFKGNIPNVSIREIAIHERENDLVLATHGRGIMIIDDITPLRQLNRDIIQEDVVFLESRPFVIKTLGYQQKFSGDDEFVGQNPQQAAYITYYLRKRHIFGDMYLEIYNADGELEKTFPAGKRRGINRVAWNTRKKAPKVPPAKSLAFGAIFGPPYAPGEYTVKIVKGEDKYEGNVQIQYDPNSPHSEEDRAAQFDALMKAYNLLEDLTFIDKQVTDIMDQIKELKESDKLKSSMAKKLDILNASLETIHKSLVETREGDITGEEQIRAKLSSLYGSISSYGGRPTQSQINGLAILEGEMNTQKDSFDKIMNKDLKSINEALAKAGLNELKILSFDEYQKDNEE